MAKNNLLPFERCEREVFVRREVETSPKFGCNPNERPIEDHIEYSIVNIDKPKGPTSHQVSSYAQKILKLKKGGHGGTLDPGVTGVLAIAMGKATRVIQALLPAGKEYICIMHLHKELDPAKVKEACESFVGKIKQLPPIKSAIKRQERYRKIYYLEVLEIEEKDVLFVVGCQAGTYIRKLCHDIGVKLDTGAHMAELRRTKAGPFNESTIVSLQNLTDAFHYYKKDGDEKQLRKYVQPMEAAVRHLPKVWVMDTTVSSLCHGANLKVPGISKVEADIQVDEMIAVMTLKNELIGLGNAKMISKEMVKKDKGIAINVDKIFMPRDTYPRIEVKQ